MGLLSLAAKALGVSKPYIFAQLANKIVSDQYRQSVGENMPSMYNELNREMAKGPDQITPNYLKYGPYPQAIAGFENFMGSFWDQMKR